MPRRALLPSILGLFVSSPAFAQASTNDAIVRVVDVGAGLCVVIAVPDGHGMLFDAGPQGATRCQAAVRELVPGRRLDLAGTATTRVSMRNGS